MKTTSPDGRFWIDIQNEHEVAIGLTAPYLSQIGVIWNFIPKADRRVEEGKIFAHFESSKTLGAFRSPVTGTIVAWNQTALETPEQLTTDDYILRVHV